MKNDKFIDAWDDITPSGDTVTRIRKSLLRDYHKQENIKKVRAKKGFKIAAPIAVVLALAVLTGGIVHRSSIKTFQYASGDVLTFRRTDVILSDLSIAEAPVYRDLTREETVFWFGQLQPDEAKAAFGAETGALRWIEAKAIDVDILIAEQGQSPKDTIIVGEENVSMVHDTAVTTGYCITDANSRGERNVIYYAFFTKGSRTCYLESSGPKDEEKSIYGAVSHVVEALVEVDTWGILKMEP